MLLATEAFDPVGDTRRHLLVFYVIYFAVTRPGETKNADISSGASGGTAKLTKDLASGHAGEAEL